MTHQFITTALISLATLSTGCAVGDDDVSDYCDVEAETETFNLHETFPTSSTMSGEVSFKPIRLELADEDDPCAEPDEDSD